MGGSFYFLSFIDEFTRYMWIYVIENKIAVFTQFNKFKLLVKNKMDVTLRD